MNERIQELAEQATSIQGPTPYNPLTFEVFDKEKFAELIIEECAKIADTERSNSVGCGYITKTNGMRIKEHFGVNE
jgi:hypothetical protein